MRLALGIDGGGSKCDAAAMDESGAVVGWGRGGPTHIYYDPPELIASSYVAAIEGALSGVSGAEVWAAGCLPEGRAREAVGARNLLVQYRAASEVDTGFASAHEQWGLIVLAGTGSFVHARRPEGREVHFGGAGPVLGDQGSAYAMGLLGLRAAFYSTWTRARRTSLATAIPAALAVTDLRGVFNQVYVEGIGRRQIAALAKVVNEEAEKGDRVALRCVRSAADELADMAAEALRELKMRDLAFPLIAIGGVARNSRLWWDRVCLRLARVAPAIRPVTPELLPAVGAALLALEAMGLEVTSKVVRRARETVWRVSGYADWAGPRVGRAEGDRVN